MSSNMQLNIVDNKGAVYYFTNMQKEAIIEFK